MSLFDAVQFLAQLQAFSCLNRDIGKSLILITQCWCPNQHADDILVVCPLILDIWFGHKYLSYRLGGIILCLFLKRLRWIIPGAKSWTDCWVSKNLGFGLSPVTQVFSLVTVRNRLDYQILPEKLHFPIFSSC